MIQSYKDQFRVKRGLTKKDKKFLRDLNVVVSNAGEHLNNGNPPDQFYWSHRHSLPAHFRQGKPYGMVHTELQSISWDSQVGN